MMLPILLQSIYISDLMNYQYFISVVPTDVQTAAGFTYNTFQYSVKDQVGSRSLPGSQAHREADSSWWAFQYLV